MAKYQKKKEGTGLIPKAGIFAAIMAVLYFGYQFFNSGNGNGPATDLPETEVVHPANTPERSPDGSGPRDIPGTPALPAYLPEGGEGTLIQHQYYTLSYADRHEQAEWVAYELTREQLNSGQVDRSDEFRTDPAVRSGSATTWDYKGSGYDRGHLVPAADRAFSERAMRETFLMSNISPQIGPFNKGIWRELEEQTRDWARKFKRLYIVSGPVLSKKPSGTIGDSGVSVPVSYFKVILDADDPEKKGIAFIIPNDISDIPLTDFAISIDDAERITGLDFFAGFMPDEIEKIERKKDISLWEFDEKRFHLRVTKWNHQ